MARIFGLARGDGATAEAMGARLGRGRTRRPSLRLARVGDAVVGVVEGGGGGLAFDGEVAVVLDGYVHNRAALGGRGDDADLLLHLYRDEGLEAALRLVNGEFAVAVVDARSGTLTLGRDRFGLKPLYWAETPAGDAFASQPSGLLGLAGVPTTPRRAFVSRYAGSHYRTFDNEPDRSPYEAIAQVPQSHVVERRNGRGTARRWWTLEPEDLTGASPHELAGRYRDLLQDAVAIRLDSATKPAFTLSGGMDSSSVLSSAAVATGQAQVAFSTVYEDKTYDERDDIAAMLETRVSTWVPVAVDEPDVFAIAAELADVHDEPVATATWLSHWVLAGEVAGAGFDAVFGGMGGDELNAGEFEYFAFHFADLRVAGREDDLEREIEGWARHHDHPIWRKDRDVAERMLREQVDFAVPGRVVVNIDRLERYADAVEKSYADLRGWRPVMDAPFSSYLLNRTYQDIFRETAPCCLRAEDRHAARLGLHRFDPFFDHRLVELMFSVPGDLKIRDGVTKQLLREAMRGVLPEETRTRVKKTGWNAPAHTWFSGDGLDAVRTLVRSERFRDRGIYDSAAVERIIDEHEAIVRSGEQRDNHMMFLWQLVNLDAWLAWVEDERWAVSASGTPATSTWCSAP